MVTLNELMLAYKISIRHETFRKTGEVDSLGQPKYEYGTSVWVAECQRLKEGCEGSTPQEAAEKLIKQL